jgi:hypothetical protein
MKRRQIIPPHILETSVEACGIPMTREEYDQSRDRELAGLREELIKLRKERDQLAHLVDHLRVAIYKARYERLDFWPRPIWIWFKDWVKIMWEGFIQHSIGNKITILILLSIGLFAWVGLVVFGIGIIMWIIRSVLA